METQVANRSQVPQASGQVPQANGAPERRPTRSPRVDIYESDAEIVVLADVPGVPADGVRLDIDRGELQLRADSPTGSPLGGVVWSRTFLMPRGVKAEDIRAELKHGVLRIVLPKSAELRRRQVEVKPG